MELPADSFAALGKRTAAPHVFGDKDWDQWGCGVIRGEDGKYHMFYARWPRAYGHSAWLTHSEIAHAVSDRPDGPYTYVDTALTRRGGDWDQIQAHNPKILKFDGRYYLYYIGTHVDAGREAMTDEELIETAQLAFKGPRWNELRNNQRTGVAVSDSINGPWQRCADPIIEPSGPIEHLTVNPTVCQGGDGRYYMMIKGDTVGSKTRQRSQAIGISDSPTGPFAIQPNPALDEFDTEDADMWYDAHRERFYAIFHMHKNIAMITSEDGLSWTKSKSFKVTPNKVFCNADTDEKHTIRRVERPFLLRDEEGEPLLLFVAALDGKQSYNLALDLK